MMIYKQLKVVRIKKSRRTLLTTRANLYIQDLAEFLGRESDRKETLELKSLAAKYIVDQCFYVKPLWDNILNIENTNNSILKIHNYLRMLNWIFIELSAFPSIVKKDEFRKKLLSIFVSAIASAFEIKVERLNSSNIELFSQAFIACRTLTYFFLCCQTSINDQRKCWNEIWLPLQSMLPSKVGEAEILAQFEPLWVMFLELAVFLQHAQPHVLIYLLPHFEAACERMKQMISVDETTSSKRVTERITEFTDNLNTLPLKHDKETIRKQLLDVLILPIE